MITTMAIGTKEISAQNPGRLAQVLLNLHRLHMSFFVIVIFLVIFIVSSNYNYKKARHPSRHPPGLLTS